MARREGMTLASPLIQCATIDERARRGIDPSTGRVEGWTRPSPAAGAGAAGTREKGRLHVLGAWGQAFSLRARRRIFDHDLRSFSRLLLADYLYRATPQIYELRLPFASAEVLAASPRTRSCALCLWAAALAHTRSSRPALSHDAPWSRPRGAGATQTMNKQYTSTRHRTTKPQRSKQRSQNSHRRVCGQRPSLNQGPWGRGQQQAAASNLPLPRRVYSAPIGRGGWNALSIVRACTRARCCSRFHRFLTA